MEANAAQLRHPGNMAGYLVGCLWLSTDSIQNLRVSLFVVLDDFVNSSLKIGEYVLMCG